jgi:uncharacterized protein (TIGR02996 family)
MTTGAALLNAIRAAPEDDTARLVYADYLDEQGGATDAARAEFIRVQVALDRLPELDPQRVRLEDRENELLRANETAWLGDLPAEVTGWKFERGFLAELRGAPTVLARAEVRHVFECHPITRLRVLCGPRPSDGCARLARVDWLPRVRELELDNVSTSSAGASALLTSPHLANLSALALTRIKDPADLSTLLARCPWLPTLKRLELAHWNALSAGERLAEVLEGSGVEDLRCSSSSVSFSALLKGHLPERLKRFEVDALNSEQWQALTDPHSKPGLTHLGTRSLSQGAIQDLLAAPACAKVVELDLNETRVPAETVEALVRSEFWRRCRAFSLIRGSCPPGTAKVLAKRTRAPQLRILKLGETGLRDEGLERICSAPWADDLTTLDVMRNHLTDDACETIRATGRLMNVRHLDIRTNGPKLAANIPERITNAGLVALAQAPGLGRLRHLNAHSLPIGTRGAVALLTSPHFRLADLDIGGTDVTGVTIRELARCPNLARLTRLSLSFANELKGDDLLPLIESEHLSPLCTVGATLHQFSPRCRDALRARLGRRFQS